MKAQAEVGLVSAVFAAIAGLTVYGFASRSWMPAVASEHGPGVDGMIDYLLVATGALFVVGHAVLAWFIWQGRRGDAPKAPRVKPIVEWLWALVPALAMTVIAEFGVLALGLPVWGKVYGPPPKDALVVEVVGKQFEWLVRYAGPDGKFGRTEPRHVHAVDNPMGLDAKDPAAKDDVVLQTLHLPVGRPILVRLRSHDVIHSFGIPEFRVKQDVIPGYVATAQFTPTRVGTFEIACAELCGLGHYKMRGVVIVEPPAAFEAWLKEEVGAFE
jgi:cytochrome c oxidase subunit 2